MFTPQHRNKSQNLIEFYARRSEYLSDAAFTSEGVKYICLGAGLLVHLSTIEQEPVVKFGNGAGIVVRDTAAGVDPDPKIRTFQKSKIAA
jgi:hypothetical protein